MTDTDTDEKPNPYVVAAEDYIALDFSPEGEAARDLMAQAEQEALNEEISLSDIVGSNPPNLTPAMLDWYALRVAARRLEALNGLCRYFSDLSGADKAAGFALQLREGTLDENLLQDKLKAYKDHDDRFYTNSQKIRDTRSRLIEERRIYENKKAALGRDARLTNRYLYLGVLTFVIFGSEAALNLESFEALPWATPAIAWGATIVIGLAIGLAAHYHGLVYRQYGYYFGPDQDDTKRGPAWRMVIGGATALSLALAFVYYARSAYLVAYLSSVGAFGQGGQQAGLAWVVLGSLLGNLLVYLTGVLWAYLLHDADPEFVDAKIAVMALEKKLLALEKTPERDLSRTLEQMNASHRKALEGARRSYALLSSQPRFRQAQDLFARVQKQDEAVLGLLLAYRNKLVQKLANARKTRFIACNDGPHLRYEPITPIDYQRRPIRLKYLEA